MEDPQYLGTVFSYVFFGLECQIEFRYRESKDPETGIKIPIVDQIKVYGPSKQRMEDSVDKQEVERLCLEKAAEILSLDL